MKMNEFLIEHLHIQRVVEVIFNNLGHGHNENVGDIGMLLNFGEKTPIVNVLCSFCTETDFVFLIL